MTTSHNVWINAWYGKSKWIYLLLPLSWLFRCVSAIRKYFLIHFSQQRFDVPVIVVGNISVGGTGKTPLIIALVDYLQKQGHKPGVVSRGYGGKATNYPYLLNEASQPHESGDEPLLIFNATKCAVCVSPDRVAAVNELIKLGCTIVLSDDGLQHYRLGRSMEIAVVDGDRLFGNEHILPVGPLREPVSRLESVDIVIVNGLVDDNINHALNYKFPMQIKPLFWKKVDSSEVISLENFSSTNKLTAVAGIGNPERFYKTLSDMNLRFSKHSFDDHHKFSAEDFEVFGDANVVMTEKDA